MGIETICCAPLLRMLQRERSVGCVGEDDGALFRRLFNWEHEGSVKCQSGQREGGFQADRMSYWGVGLLVLLIWFVVAIPYQYTLEGRTTTPRTPMNQKERFYVFNSHNKRDQIPLPIKPNVFLCYSSSADSDPQRETLLTPFNPSCFIGIRLQVTVNVFSPCNTWSRVPSVAYCDLSSKCHKLSKIFVHKRLKVVKFAVTSSTFYPYSGGAFGRI